MNHLQATNQAKSRIATNAIVQNGYSSCLPRGMFRIVPPAQKKMPAGVSIRQTNPGGRTSQQLNARSQLGFGGEFWIKKRRKTPASRVNFYRTRAITPRPADGPAAADANHEPSKVLKEKHLADTTARRGERVMPRSQPGESPR